MKTKIFGLVLILFTLLFTVDSFAQPGRRAQDLRTQQRYAERPMDRPDRPQRQMLDGCIIPDLTEQQASQIKTLRLANLEVHTQHRNQMDELRARKRNLMTQKNADNDAIEALIDEMTALKNAHMKEAANHRQAIRSMLTDEQRVIFDSRHTNRPGGRGAYGRQGDTPRMRRW